jgi:Protein of unknown function (DUF732)
MNAKVLVAGLIGAGLVTGAPTAQADATTYLAAMMPDGVYNIQGPQRLVDEGYKVCQFLRTGPTGSQSMQYAAANMVQADLSVPLFTATTIVRTAVGHLSC